MYYYCHNCKQTFDVKEQGDVRCIHCDSEFVEEQEDINRATDATTRTTVNLTTNPITTTTTSTATSTTTTTATTATTAITTATTSTSTTTTTPNTSAPNRTSSATRRPGAFFSPRTSSSARGGDDDDDDDDEYEDIPTTTTSNARNRHIHTHSRSRTRRHQPHPMEILMQMIAAQQMGQPPGAGGGMQRIDVNQLMMALSNPMFMATLMGEDEMVGNPGDYVATQEQLDDFISQLRDQDTNFGPPPAKQEAINKLPFVTVDQKIVDDKDMRECSICQEEFTLNTKVRQVPCGHLFHNDCLIPWLKAHNTCPLCRFKLEAEEPSTNK